MDDRATSSRIQPPAVNLKERIAALQQRTASNTSNPRAVSPPAPGPSTHVLNDPHQPPNGKGLRDKIAKFEQKGGVPIPRGSFGLGAPPLPDNGQPKRRGELYGNRIPAPLRSGILSPQVTGGGGSWRSVSSPAGALTPQMTGGNTLSPQVTGGTLASWRSMTSSPPSRTTSPTDPTWVGASEEGSLAEHVTTTSSFADLALPDSVVAVATLELATMPEDEEPVRTSLDNTHDGDAEVVSERSPSPPIVQSTPPPSIPALEESVPPSVSPDQPVTDEMSLPSGDLVHSEITVPVDEACVEITPISSPVPDAAPKEPETNEPEDTLPSTPPHPPTIQVEITQAVPAPNYGEDLAQLSLEETIPSPPENDASDTNPQDVEPLDVSIEFSDSGVTPPSTTSHIGQMVNINDTTPVLVATPPDDASPCTPTPTITSFQAVSTSQSASTIDVSANPPPSPRARSATSVSESHLTPTNATPIVSHRSSHSESVSHLVSKPPTPDAATIDFVESPSAPKPISFSAIVHKKVTEPAVPLHVPKAHMTLMQSSRKRESYGIDPLSPTGGGELSKLVEDAALLELLLSGGELPSEQHVDVPEVQPTVEEIAEPEVPVEPTLVEPEPQPEPSRGTSLSSFKAVLSRSKSVLDRDSLDQTHTSKQQRRKTALPFDSHLSVMGTQLEQDIPPTPPPKSPGRHYGAMGAPSAGESNVRRRPSAVMPGAYPRDSVSLSSEDSVAVVTPPDNSVTFPGTFDNGSVRSFGNAANTLSVTEFGSAGSGVSRAGTVGPAWPSASPKKSKSFSRAASFAGKMFQRARTKSSGSTLSVDDVARRMAAEAAEEPLPQPRKSLAPSISSRGLQPPSPTYPTSPDRPESWISVSSTTSSARTIDLFDAFPSVPQIPGYHGSPVDPSHVNVPFPSSHGGQHRPSF